MFTLPTFYPLGRSTQRLEIFRVELVVITLNDEWNSVVKLKRAGFELVVSDVAPVLESRENLFSELFRESSSAFVESYGLVRVY